MQTASDIIQLFGGPAKLARESRIPLTTIIGWRDRGFIPDWRKPALLTLAQQHGKKLADSDFPVTPAPSPKERGAASA